MLIKKNTLTFDAKDLNIQWNVEVNISDKPYSKNDFGQFHKTTIKINNMIVNTFNVENLSGFIYNGNKRGCQTKFIHNSNPKFVELMELISEKIQAELNRVGLPSTEPYVDNKITINKETGEPYPKGISLGLKIYNDKSESSLIRFYDISDGSLYPLLDVTRKIYPGPCFEPIFNADRTKEKINAKSYIKSIYGIIVTDINKEYSNEEINTFRCKNLPFNGSGKCANFMKFKETKTVRKVIFTIQPAFTGPKNTFEDGRPKTSLTIVPSVMYLQSKESPLDNIEDIIELDIKNLQKNKQSLEDQDNHLAEIEIKNEIKNEIIDDEDL